MHPATKNRILPLPPYIHRDPGVDDDERYQTVFARELGAVAAPTAGLHFDDALLEALRAQLNPHFLFNALNSVAEMVHIDGELADRMLVALSALLRDALKQEPQQERPLREEIAAIEHYLTIEKIRLGERLQVRWDVDPACLEAPVPVLILQPLVENAIVHAIARRKASGMLAIAASDAGDTLLLRVENSAAPDDGDRRGNGIGLRSVADRLHLLYGERARMQRIDVGSGAYGVELRLPLARRAGAAVPAGAFA